MGGWVRSVSERVDAGCSIASRPGCPGLASLACIALDRAPKLGQGTPCSARSAGLRKTAAEPEPQEEQEQQAPGQEPQEQEQQGAAAPGAPAEAAPEQEERRGEDAPAAGPSPAAAPTPVVDPAAQEAGSEPQQEQGTAQQAEEAAVEAMEVDGASPAEQQPAQPAEELAPAPPEQPAAAEGEAGPATAKKRVRFAGPECTPEGAARDATMTIHLRKGDLRQVRACCWGGRRRLPGSRSWEAERCL